MNDEIKELLDVFNALINEYSPTTSPFELEEYEIKYSQIKSLLDYITNLQEENKHLDEVNCQLRKKINNDIYKSRCKKDIR